MKTCLLINADFTPTARATAKAVDSPQPHTATHLPASAPTPFTDARCHTTATSTPTAHGDDVDANLRALDDLLALLHGGASPRALEWQPPIAHTARTLLRREGETAVCKHCAAPITWTGLRRGWRPTDDRLCLPTIDTSYDVVRVSLAHMPED